MSGPEAARDARSALARRIAVLRRTAGLTQRELGVLAGYSRSAVARAEASGACSRPFCVRAGRALGVGGELAAAHDRSVSVEVISWAPNLAPVPADRGGQPSSACKFVLVGLANHAGPDGTGAFRRWPRSSATPACPSARCGPA